MPERTKKRFTISIWICGLAILAASCGGDNGDENGVRCVVEALTAGTYSFTVAKVDDKCAGGAVADLIGEGPYEFDLPSYADLQAGPVDVEARLPGIGAVTVRFELEGGKIKISLPNEVPPILLSGTCFAEGTAKGSLCPLSETEANATFVLTLEDLVGTCGNIEKPKMPCDVTVQLEGQRQ